jgi:hypothetical protein
MSTYVSVNGVHYHEGCVMQAKEIAEEMGICSKGKFCRIVKIIWKKNGQCQIGALLAGQHSAWHHMDGMVPDNRGYWLDAEHLGEAFELAKMKIEIIGDAHYRAKDLKGRKGVYLSSFGDAGGLPPDVPISAINVKHVFVELEDNVGGSGCEGMGKRGHCVMVPRECVRFEDSKTAKLLHL